MLLLPSSKTPWFLFVWEFFPPETWDPLSLWWGFLKICNLKSFFDSVFDLALMRCPSNVEPKNLFHYFLSFGFHFQHGGSFSWVACNAVMPSVLRDGLWDLCQLTLLFFQHNSSGRIYVHLARFARRFNPVNYSPQLFQLFHNEFPLNMFQTTILLYPFGFFWPL